MSIQSNKILKTYNAPEFYGEFVAKVDRVDRSPKRINFFCITTDGKKYRIGLSPKNINWNEAVGVKRGNVIFVFVNDSNPMVQDLFKFDDDIKLEYFGDMPTTYPRQ